MQSLNGFWQRFLVFSNPEVFAQPTVSDTPGVFAQYFSRRMQSLNEQWCVAEDLRKSEKGKGATTKAVELLSASVRKGETEQANNKPYSALKSRVRARKVLRVGYYAGAVEALCS
jgi:hypothetical protein